MNHRATEDTEMAEFDWDAPECQTFDHKIDDGRVAHCEEMRAERYQDCRFSAGTCTGVDPDTVFLSVANDSGEKDMMIFLRPDEMVCLMAASVDTMWCERVNQLHEEGD